MNRRLSDLRDVLEEKSLGSFVITEMENIRYLSGFTGSSAVAVVTMDGDFLVTDGRYCEQARLEAPEWETVIHKGEISKAIAGMLKSFQSIGFEATASFEFIDRLRNGMPDQSKLVPTKDIVEELRLFKDESEISRIRESLECAAKAFAQILPLVVPGKSEREIAAELDYRMTLAGADGPAFDTVVASGPNSSMPHAGVTDRALGDSELVVIDFGARKNGYCTDTSRTLVVGEPDRRQHSLLESVREASDAALATLKPGIPASEADEAARKVIADRGLADKFNHGLGHGVGLDVHEKPTLSALSEDTLQPSMVFTIEPGIYIEGWGGVRNEDMILMTSGIAEVLTRDILSR